VDLEFYLIHQLASTISENLIKKNCSGNTREKESGKLIQEKHEIKINFRDKK